MARLSRNLILYDGCYAHIISRSIRKQKILNDDEDFQNFQNLLLSVKRKYPFQLFHYCLMHTHFHLAVAIPDVDMFSKAMQQLKSLYCQNYHLKHKLSGPIWRERFRSLLIEDEAYMYACGQYIEYNPIKANMVDQAVDWAYSSSRHYLNGEADELVDTYQEGIPSLPSEVNVMDEDAFERNSAIGSGFFRLQMTKMQREARVWAK